MKRPIAPPLLDHRVTRVISWATLWLVWAGALLAGLQCGFRKNRTLDGQHHRFALITRLVLNLLVVRAFHLPPRFRRAPRAYGPNAYRRMTAHRANIGSVLRKQFRAPTLLARIAKLSDALRNPENYTPAIAKRLARNLTKIVRLYAPTFIVAALSAPRAISEAALDSS
jgi:hypothetical protein